MWRIFFALLFLQTLEAVDRQNFKTCEQSGFCKRHRKAVLPTGYEVVTDSISINGTGLDALIKSKDSTLKLSIVSLKDSTVRILIDENGESLRKRYQPLDALVDKEPEQQKWKKTKQDATATKLLTTDGNRIVLHYKPFRVDFFVKDKIVSSINSKESLFFENFKKKVLLSDRENGFWEETFKDIKDTKPYGSSSVGVDIAFVGAKHLFGIPEHAESYSLRDTKTYEPYRLYNLDVFEYETNSPMALYGSIPYLVGVNKKRSVGALWLNAAETWVDIESTTADKGSLANEVLDSDTKPRQVPQQNVRFYSESGVIDIFITLGPQPNDIYRQLAALTGVTPLPPIFALGYHQSRWNYKDQKDVKEVHEGFVKNEIPLDVLWLDIEHTDQKAYFTFDKDAFAHPEEMVKDLADKGRKLVTIVDPHIKKDSKYYIYKEAKKNKLLVKDAKGSIYVGNCWPGDSTYIDFLNPEARSWWSEQFSFDKYKGTSNDVHIWNDMNEPSVFNGPEITMHKDAKHYDGFEHRDVHNVYGFYQHSSTFEGIKARSNKEVRPFVLSRSFFAGSQRTTAVWTGDNKADWAHLKQTIPMLLSISTAGLPFVGADVGGFFGNPEEELLVRWYQAGAFQPFFRAHSHQDTKRREPWLFSDNTTDAIRTAVKNRYSFLPYWYTLFYEHAKTGKPVMRPFWVEFIDDEASWDEDRQWMVGSGLLVKPVLEEKIKELSIYLPGKRQVWYDWNNHKARPSPGAVQIPVDINTIGLYHRGGTIIPKLSEVKLTTKDNQNQPITLYIAVNQKGDHANGTIYLDDGESYGYENGEYAYWGFTFKREHDYLHTITNKNLDKKGKHDSDVYIDKIVIRGAKFYPRNAHIFLDDFSPEDLDFEFNRENFVMEIANPGAFVTREFRIDIHS
ncbi:CBN-AAGR-4 protein [Caenorhabditis brenneri]|uniref:CBN-AAGR-4 protein n=1 Tax=Caenorhabditis brenneri TaxID=135651 RepID=G0P3C4_CAEBE|nr:CBN-AAGR-4 protein [Caenorhabditis brenneri]